MYRPTLKYRSSYTDGYRGHYAIPSAPEATTLIHYWPLEDSIANPQEDLVGGNDLLPVSLYQGASVAGKNNNAVSMSTYAVVSGWESTDPLTISDKFTVAFWYKNRRALDINTHLGYAVGLNNQPGLGPSLGVFGYDNIQVTDYNTVSVGGAGESLYFGPNIVTDRVWHLVVFGRTPTQGFVSVDGGDLITADSTVPTAIEKLLLTGFTYGPITLTQPIYDEVAVWNGALTQDSVNELWNSGAGKFYPF